MREGEGQDSRQLRRDFYGAQCDEADELIERIGQPYDGYPSVWAVAGYQSKWAHNRQGWKDPRQGCGCLQCILFHEGIATVVEVLDRQSGVSKPDKYYLGAARNAMKTLKRGEKRRQDREKTYRKQKHAHSETDPSEVIAFHELRDSLTPAQREVLDLWATAADGRVTRTGRSYTEIAEILGRSKSTVQGHMREIQKKAEF